MMDEMTKERENELQVLRCELEEEREKLDGWVDWLIDFIDWLTIYYSAERNLQTVHSELDAALNSDDISRLQQGFDEQLKLVRFYVF